MPRKKEGQKLIEEAQNLYTQKKYSEALAKLTEARSLETWAMYSDTWHSIAQDLNTAIDKALIRERGMRGDDEPVVLAEPVLLAEPVPVDKYEERDDAERRFGHDSDPEPEPEPEYVGGPRPDLLGWENATHTPGAPPVYQNKKPNKPKKQKPKKPKKGPGCCSRPQKEKRTKKKGTKRKSKKRTKKRKSKKRKSRGY